MKQKLALAIVLALALPILANVRVGVTCSQLHGDRYIRTSTQP